MNRFGNLTVILAASIGLSACAGDPAADSEDVVLRMIGAVNSRDFEALDEVVAADVRRYSGATPDLEVRSLADFKAFLHQDLASVPDALQEVQLIFSNGPFVAVHATYKGTQSGPMGPFPASNRRLELPFIAILRVENGKIAEIWVEWDNLNALSQLGHFPPPASDPVVDGRGD
jgi:predicted ester cyclase